MEEIANSIKIRNAKENDARRLLEIYAYYVKIRPLLLNMTFRHFQSFKTA